MTRAILASLLALFSLGVAPRAQTSPGAGPVIVLETAKGNIEFETYPEEAPKTVAQVVGLVKKNFYNGLEETINAYNPGMLGMGQMYLGNLNQQLGIDIKRDFFGSFGPDVISGYAPRAGAGKAASLDDLDQFIGFSLDNPRPSQRHSMRS